MIRRAAIRCSIATCLSLISLASANPTTQPIAPNGPGAVMNEAVSLLKQGDIDLAMNHFVGTDGRDELKKMSEQLQSGRLPMIVLEEKVDGDLAYVILDNTTPGRKTPKIEAGAAIKIDNRWRLIMLDLPPGHTEADQQRVRDITQRGMQRAFQLSGKGASTRPTTQP